MRRGRLVLAFCVGALVPAGAGAAHEGAPGSGFQSRVTAVEPLVPGLLVDVLGGDELLSVRNWSARTVVLEGAGGRPLLRFRGDVVERRAGRRWRVVRTGTGYVWHDPRIHATGPPPEREGVVRRWRIRGTADGEPFAILGVVGYRPPLGGAGGRDAALPAWAIALAGGVGILVVAAALALPRRPAEAAEASRRPARDD